MMTRDQLYHTVGKARVSVLKRINDIVIWINAARDSLERASHNPEFLLKLRFPVPSQKQGKRVKRKPEKVKTILLNAVHHELHEAAFVYLVAQVEALFSDVIASVLRFDNRRLKTRITGVNHVNKIDVADVLDSPSLTALIDDIIQKELTALFYAGVKVQCEYLKKVLCVDLDQNIIAQWAEIRATRDLIVHNAGVVNEVYLNKAGDSARGKLGDQLPVDQSYFEQSVAIMKTFTGRTCTRLQKTLNPDKYGKPKKRFDKPNAGNG